MRVRAFRDLWLGQAISQMGDAFYFVAFMFMVKKVTGSDAMVGAVGALETLPFLLFGPYAGVLADRIDRRKIMLVSDVVSGGALVLFSASIAVLGKPAVPTLLMVPFFLSSFRVFFMPAKSAAIPSLVPAAQLTSANALSMTTQNLMQLISLGLTAGVLSLLFALSPSLFYLTTVGLNSVSFFVSAYFIGRLPRVMPNRKDAHETHVWQDLKNGVGYLRSRHDLVVLTILLAVFRLSVAPFFVVYLAANDKWFGGKPQTIAWFEFAFVAGMVASGSYAGRLKPRYPARGFCIGLALVGVTVGLMGFSPYVSLFILWNVIAGLAIPIADVPITTYVQLSVPDAYRGRVNAVREMISVGVMPISMGLAGLIVARTGVEIAFMLMGSGMSLSCLLGLLDRRFRNIEMPETATPEKFVPTREEAPMATLI
ncbi:MFS transporter [Fimbriimonas ginsengisoli]|uniref:MFS transporter n=1 Tax=Fimbriimonas ginsengisoli TaxID=1005039 RepID=UPI00046D70A7|nr:MFS transporter [Fimbriimonas ginsengisoli]